MVLRLLGLHEHGRLCSSNKTYAAVFSNRLARTEDLAPLSWKDS